MSFPWPFHRVKSKYIRAYRGEVLMCKRRGKSKGKKATLFVLFKQWEEGERESSPRTLAPKKNTPSLHPFL